MRSLGVATLACSASLLWFAQPASFGNEGFTAAAEIATAMGVVCGAALILERRWGFPGCLGFSATIAFLGVARLALALLPQSSDTGPALLRFVAFGTVPCVALLVALVVWARRQSLAV